MTRLSTQSTGTFLCMSQYFVFVFVYFVFHMPEVSIACML